MSKPIIDSTLSLIELVSTSTNNVSKRNIDDLSIVGDYIRYHVIYDKENWLEKLLLCYHVVNFDMVNFVTLFNILPYEYNSNDFSIVIFVIEKYGYIHIHSECIDCPSDEINKTQQLVNIIREEQIQRERKIKYGGIWMLDYVNLPSEIIRWEIYPYW